ncbi:MAG: toll/interleukin-1 receptor domain-containing protein [Algoriphagus sp.]|uniref:toll/interleukin-1 receptor domain-containing protein n=1 Tax=Algoriphagus sp. TaxID=1872435 RepID=UPI002623B2F8|nr:toll/interleukin-1 receptor domain-containing protein [Algoriphagus sp.]MDG1278336.1 toll/interleukin-1 receptor domain-containing protein [Algoriphagus sp.]
MQKNKIFISYRQSDTQSEASRLKENLEDVFGKENVFFDIETLEPGLNFAKAIEKTIRQSAVVLVLIGETWTEVKDEEGNLRLFKENDWVRKEVAMALSMEDTRVIPVLVKDAKKLTADQLPDNIKALADYQWAELTIPRWRSDVEKLITVLRKITQQLDTSTSKNKFEIHDLFKPPKEIGDLFKPAKESKDLSSLQGVWKAYRYYIIAFIIFVIGIDSCSEEQYYYNDFGYNEVFDPILQSSYSKYDVNYLYIPKSESTQLRNKEYKLKKSQAFRLVSEAKNQSL